MDNRAPWFHRRSQTIKRRKTRSHSNGLARRISGQSGIVSSEGLMFDSLSSLPPSIFSNPVSSSVIRYPCKSEEKDDEILTPIEEETENGKRPALPHREISSSRSSLNRRPAPRIYRGNRTNACAPGLGHKKSKTRAARYALPPRRMDRSPSRPSRS